MSADCVTILASDGAAKVDTQKGLKSLEIVRSSKTKQGYRRRKDEIVGAFAVQTKNLSGMFHAYNK